MFQQQQKNYCYKKYQLRIRTKQKQKEISQIIKNLIFIGCFFFVSLFSSLCQIYTKTKSFLYLFFKNKSFLIL